MDLLVDVEDARSRFKPYSLRSGASTWRANADGSLPGKDQVIYLVADFQRKCQEGYLGGMFHDEWSCKNQKAFISRLRIIYSSGK